MKDTANCCDKISREHYISKSILSQFDKIHAAGLPWHQDGAPIEYGIENLTSRVLCVRHNSAMSPLDDAAGKAFAALREGMNHVTKRSLSSRSRFFLVSGDGLELWGIKTLLGLLSAKIARNQGVDLATEYGMDFEMAQQALSGLGLKASLGLYVHPSQGIVYDRIGVSPLACPQERIINGLRVEMIGVSFDFILDKRGGNREFFDEGKFYRPWIIDLEGSKRSARIVLTWASRTRTAKRVSLRID